MNTTPRARMLYRIVPSVFLLLIVTAIITRSSGAAAPAAGALADSLPAARTGIEVSLAEVFFIQRNPSTREVEWLGSIIIWFLLILSAVNLALTAILAWDNRKDMIAPPGLIARAETLLRDRRTNELLDFTRADPSYFAGVIQAAILEQSKGPAAMIRAAESEAGNQALRRLRRIEPLNIIGNISPMIGLFGTVYGMILAFQAIVSAGGTPDPVNLAAGIGTALVTTFWGLIVAIPGLASYAFLRNRIDELTAFASTEADRMLETLRTPASENRA